MFALGLVELALARIAVVLDPVAVALLGILSELPQPVPRVLAIELLLVGSAGGPLFALHPRVVGIATGLPIVELALLAVSARLVAIDPRLIPIELFLLIAAVASLTHRFALLRFEQL